MPTDGQVVTPLYDERIGARVREALREHGRTQQELAFVLGIDPAAVNRRLTGRTAWKASELADTAAMVGVSVADLMTWGQAEAS